MKRLCGYVTLLVVTWLHPQAQQKPPQNYPPPQEGFWVITDFAFKSGDTLPQLKLHYYTIGTPVRDEKGDIRNAVVILHGTGSSAQSFLGENFAGVLFGPGQALDASRFFIILPDSVGHGQSSKPSDGLHMRFPHYDYDDMIEAQRRLIVEGLNVKHLRLLMGISMGGMETWVWGERHPTFMDALMPVVCMPTQIAGRNRMWRRMIMDLIREDPDWANGDYKAQPRSLAHAAFLGILMGTNAIQLQRQAPTRDMADALLRRMVEASAKPRDANDLIYQVNSSRNYDPAPELEKIQAPLLAVNFADDLINPPELGVMEREIRRVKRGRYVLVPASEETRGHISGLYPELWKQYVAEILAGSGRGSGAAY